jgi:hypothetical protein
VFNTISASHPGFWVYTVNRKHRAEQLDAINNPLAAVFEAKT